MPKLNHFDILIKTGASAGPYPPKWTINGFPVEFEEHKGGTGPGETFESSADPQSFPHTLLLRGPEQGTWEIDEVQVTYYPEGEPPYTVRLGKVTLDGESDLNVWHERPQPVFDV
jgi:hypothetical protein